MRGAERLVSALRSNISDALLFRFLARLRFDVPLGGSSADLEWRGVPRKRFLEFCDRYDFDTLRSSGTLGSLSARTEQHAACSPAQSEP